MKVFGKDFSVASITIEGKEFLADAEGFLDVPDAIEKAHLIAHGLELYIEEDVEKLEDEAQKLEGKIVALVKRKGKKAQALEDAAKAAADAAKAEAERLEAEAKEAADKEESDKADETPKE